MRFVSGLAIAISCCVSVAASASPTVHQGRVLDAVGTPQQGSMSLEVALYEVVANGSPVWSEPHTVQLEDGYYSVLLGGITPIPLGLLDGRDLWLQVSADGVAMPRQVFTEVPRATVASHIPTHSVAPVTCSTAAVGAVYLDTALSVLRVCSGAEWVSIGGGVVGGVQPVAFAPVAGLAPNTVSTSNTVTLDSIGSSVTVIITGGSGASSASLIRNGVNTNSTEAVFQPDDTLAIQMSAAPSPDALSTAVIYVGGVTTEWRLSTGANAQPTAPLVAVSPVRPLPTDTLACAITTPSTDSDGDTVSYSYEWLRNGVSTGITTPTVAPNNTSEADEWTCTVTPNDGYEDGATATAAGRVAQRFVYGYSGSNQAHQVPAWASEVTVKAWAGAGGGGAAENGSHAGGAGGYVSGRFSVSPGETLTVKVGQGGDYSSGFGYAAWPNGGFGSSRTSYFSGGGGGRSAVERGSTELAVAGGGGGAGGTGWSCGSNNLFGGGGGGTVGGSGGFCPGSNRSTNCQGDGGTQSAGGASGTGCPYSYTSSPGSRNQGGHGGQFGAAANATYGNENCGGGGGDGYFGGGSAQVHAGGGGGSSYLMPGVSDAVLPDSSSTTSPPNTSDADYGGNAGLGRTAATGLNGRVVLWVH